jgi:hypothetical protein
MAVTQYNAILDKIKNPKAAFSRLAPAVGAGKSDTNTGPAASAAPANGTASVTTRPTAPAASSALAASAAAGLTVDDARALIADSFDILGQCVAERASTMLDAAFLSVESTQTEAWLAWDSNAREVSPRQMLLLASMLMVQ